MVPDATRPCRGGYKIFQILQTHEQHKKRFTLSPTLLMVEIIARRPKQENKARKTWLEKNIFKQILVNQNTQHMRRVTYFLYTRHAVNLVHMISFKYAREIWVQSQNSCNI